MNLLKLILQLDKPPGYSKDGVDRGILGGNNGTRRIQVGLALFYLSVDKLEFASAIAEDYLDDLTYFDEKTFKQNINTQCFLLSIFGPTFWEDTDRGNLNIYFAPEKDQIEPFKELIFNLMDKRLEALERDAQFLSLEVDKLVQKKQKQDGYLNPTDKERLEDLQRKISAREKSEDEEKINWTIDHDILYTLLSIAFFADQEIDETEKNVIYENYGTLVKNVTEDSFNSDFGLAAKKFIELEKEESRQKQYEKSLLNIKNMEMDSDKLQRLLFAYIDIANADDFIHENELILIQNAIDLWELQSTINKPKSGEKLIIVK